MMRSTLINCDIGNDGVLDTGRRIYSEQGIKGFFKGSILWSLRTGVGTGIQLPMFEKLIKFQK